MSKLLLTSSLLGLALCQAANALPTQIGANRVLGIVEPATPSSEANEMDMINGLLQGWTTTQTVGHKTKVNGKPVITYETITSTVKGYNAGAPSGTVMGDNPNDPQTEKYTLLFTSPTLIPDDPNAPLVTSYYVPGAAEGSAINPVINLGNFSYDWVLAKWGDNAEVYYIGDLSGKIQLNRINLPAQGGGLSHYTLFNQRENEVPDGGCTIALLGVGLLSMGYMNRRK